MRIQLMFILLLLSLSVHSSEEKEFKLLFEKYQTLMANKKVELIEEVFSTKFLKDNGGKKELIQKIRELKIDKKRPDPKLNFRKGLMDEIYFVKLVPAGKSADSVSNEFIIKKENGKFKIDGTMTDEQ